MPVQLNKDTSYSIHFVRPHLKVETNLKFSAFDFPLRFLHFEPSPFMLDEVENPRHGVLGTSIMLFMGLLRTDANRATVRADLPVLVLRRLVHHSTSEKPHIGRFQEESVE